MKMVRVTNGVRGRTGMHPRKHHCVTEPMLLPVIAKSRSDVRVPLRLWTNVWLQSRWIPAFPGMTKESIDQAFPGGIPTQVHATCG